MMATNRGQRYFVLIVAIFHELVYGLNYPSIQWNYQNTRFQQGMYHLNVLPDAKVMVICPHTAISFVKTDLQTPADILFENFWQVDYASFQSCNVNTSNPRNKRFFKCEDPQKLQYEQFIFQSFGIGNRPTFEKGKTHYFISTANGSKESLDWTSGGHCDEYNMRLKIYVCQNSEDVLCSGAQTTTPTTAPITASSVPVNGNEVFLASTASTVPVNGNEVLLALTPNAPQTRRTQNVFERNVLLMATIITLGLLLLISLVVNIIFIKKMKSRKSPTSQTNDSDTACDV
ncbi:ephrin-B2a-like isoform X3 [Acropora muricata]|uniref:ephrin-B2a-like isoform X5 n=1 Tax=Acropora millepora TaxID=45264 RepID=UPI001CF1B5B2|nr:ephrin-B2a-like isoform X5 [Acropora millepora]